MPDLTPKRLAELRALANAATEGPWDAYTVPSARHEAGYTAVGINDQEAQIIRYDGAFFDAAFIAACRTAVPELLDEIERLRESERAFAEALGYGDGKTEPAATLADLIDPLTDALHAAREHDECPIYCPLCEEQLAATTCTRCHGSGHLPNPEMAYLECDECAGAGKIHEGCVEQTYAQLAAKVARVEKLVADWQANGNSRALGDPRADIWHKAARQLRAVLAGGEQ